MARNVEIKACIDSIEALLPQARAQADADTVLIEQDDTFFHVPQGRLKLRQFADGSAELIHYQRADSSDAKTSDYVRVPVPDAALLRESLARSCGVQGRVLKQRWLLLAGRTRIHLDRVLGLGDFMELEVVLAEGDSVAGSVDEAQSLMRALGLADAPRVAGSYFDLLAVQGFGKVPGPI